MRAATIAVLVLAGAGFTATHALSQGAAADYPQRPIRILVGFPPGARAD